MMGQTDRRTLDRFTDPALSMMLLPPLLLLLLLCPSCYYHYYYYYDDYTRQNTEGKLCLLHCMAEVWVHIMHATFNFPFKLGPKVGLHIIHESVI